MMVEALLVLVFVAQLVLIGMVWLGTNIQDRLWQIPMVGALLDRRGKCGHSDCPNRDGVCWQEVGKE